MKKKLKRNKIFIIVFAILLGWGFFSLNEYRLWRNELINAHNYYLEKCQNEYLNDSQHKEQCSLLAESNGPEIPDTISLFFDILGNYSLKFIQIVAPLFVVIVAIWNFHNQLKTGLIKNVITRMEYKKIIKSNLIKSWLYSLILPIFLIILFFICYLISGNFDVRSTIANDPGYLFIDSKFIDIFPQFIFIYLFNLVLHSIWWINLGYILSKKSRHIVVTLLSFFITYFVIYIISEILIGGVVLSRIFNLHSAMHYLNLSNIWVYEGIDNLILTNIFAILLIVISLIVLAKVYRNKEDVIIANEF